MMKLILLLAAAAAGYAAHLSWQKKTTLETLTSQVKDSEEQAESKAKSLLAKNKTKSDLEKQIKDATKAETEEQERASQRKNDVDSRQSEIAKKKSDIGRLSSEIAIIRKDVEDGGPELKDPAALQAKLSELTSENESLRGAVEKLQGDVNRAKLRVSEQRTVRASLGKEESQLAAQGSDAVRTATVRSVAPHFVVISAAGGSGGIKADDRAIIVRGGETIGITRIKTVENSQIVADIMKDTLDEGISIQPGDNVVFQRKSRVP